LFFELIKKQTIYQLAGCFIRADDLLSSKNRCIMSKIKRRFGETESRIYPRTNRFFMDNGEWFFNTREGFVKGPYASKTLAEDALLDYLMELLETDLITFPTVA